VVPLQFVVFRGGKFQIIVNMNMFNSKQRNTSQNPRCLSQSFWCLHDTFVSVRLLPHGGNVTLFWW